MDLGALIETHGYWLVALGCLLEGETLLVLAGFAAHQGHLNFGWVSLIAAATGFAGDQFYFWLGRRHGSAVLARFPSVTREVQRVYRLLDRYHAGVIIGVRFAYGLRIAGPVVIGTSNVATWRFTALNALGAALWALVVGGLGWIFGEAAEALLGKIKHIEGWLLLGLAVAIALVWLLHKRQRH